MNIPMKDDVLDQSSFCTCVNPNPGTRIYSLFGLFFFLAAYTCVLHNALWYTGIRPNNSYTYNSFQRYENKTSISKIILKTNSTYTYYNMYHLWLNHWVLYFMSTYNIICHFSKFKFKFPRIVIVINV